MFSQAKPGVRGLRSHQTLQEDTRDGQQKQRHGDLSGDEETGEPESPPSSDRDRPVIPERGSDVARGGTEGRYQPEHEPRAHGHDEREEEHGTVETHVE